MKVDADGLDRLACWAKSRTLPVRVVARSRIVLLLASGLTVAQTAHRLGLSPTTVRLWHRRYQERGPDGLLRDRPGRGRKPRVDASVWLVLANRSPAARTDRALARAMGVSPSTVSRWRTRSRRSSDDR